MRFDTLRFFYVPLIFFEKNLYLTEKTNLLPVPRSVQVSERQLLGDLFVSAIIHLWTRMRHPAAHLSIWRSETCGYHDLSANVWLIKPRLIQW